MFDLNTIITQALAAAVAQATAPLIKRIEELEAKTQTKPLDINAAMDELNQQEWFWAKINSYIDAGIDASTEEFVRKDDLPDFDEFVFSNDLPDFDDFVTKDELPEFPDADDIITTNTIKDYVDEALSDIRLVRR